MLDLLVVNLLELVRKVLTVRAAPVEPECLACLGVITYALLELLEDRPVRRPGDGCPVKGAVASGRRARVVHVIHPRERVGMIS